MDDCWQGVGGWLLRLRLCRLLYCMGVVVELVLGVGGMMVGVIGWCGWLCGVVGVCGWAGWVWWQDVGGLV